MRMFLLQLTEYIMEKEMTKFSRMEDLRFSDAMKNKTREYVKIYMSKFTDGYKKSPQNNS